VCPLLIKVDREDFSAELCGGLLQTLHRVFRVAWFEAVARVHAGGAVRGGHQLLGEAYSTCKIKSPSCLPVCSKIGRHFACSNRTFVCDTRAQSDNWRRNTRAARTVGNAGQDFPGPGWPQVDQRNQPSQDRRTRSATPCTLACCSFHASWMSPNPNHEERVCSQP